MFFEVRSFLRIVAKKVCCPTLSIYEFIYKARLEKIRVLFTILMKLHAKLGVQPDTAVIEHHFFVSVNNNFPAIEQNRLTVMHLLQHLLYVTVACLTFPTPVQSDAQVVASTQRQDCNSWVFNTPLFNGWFYLVYHTWHGSISATYYDTSVLTLFKDTQLLF